MGKPLSEQDVIQLVKENGYIYYTWEKRRDGKNKRSYTWVKVSCGKHSAYWVRVGHFKRGQRCHKCSIENNTKWNKQNIKKYVSDSKYKLIRFLEDNIRLNTRLLVECDNGHIPYEVNFSNFYNGTRCPYCAGNKKHTYEHIRHEIEKDGLYTLLSKEYINNGEYLIIHCKKHQYTFKMKFANWSQGNRCKLCRNDELSEARRYNYLYIKQEIESKGELRLVSRTYKNNSTPIKIKCLKCDGIFADTYSNFRLHNSCKLCERKYRYDPKYLLSEYQRVFNEIGKIPNQKDMSKFNAPSLSTYRNYFGAIKNVFNALGINAMSYYNKHYGTLCKDKNGYMCSSKTERKITNFLIDNNIKFQKEVPYNSIINTTKSFRFDWVIYYNEEKFYVEYFGMHSLKKESKPIKLYCKKVSVKKQLLTKNNIINNSILIYPDDLKQKSLKEIFKKVLK